MSSVIMMLPAFLRDIQRYRASATLEGIVLSNGHNGRAFNLVHHDKQQLVDAVSSLAEAIQTWAKTEPTPEQPVIVSPVKDGPYGPIHEPPADILMGSFAAKKEAKPDIMDGKVQVEVKKRSYTKRKKDV